MAQVAGALIKATDFGFTGQEAVMGASYSVTTVQADIGLSVTFPTVLANQQALVYLNSNLQCNTAVASRFMNLYCLVDGVAETSTLPWLVNANQNAARVPGFKSWRVTLVAVGSHTVKIQGQTGTTNGDFTVVGGDIIVVPCL
ncbi:hypothetical protein [Mycobacterium sp.]|uniref:hypothetical protein n=1 Tax=Mycobacterium sp. TaxID=1785 RepID=UPI002BC593AB|nr:hypothetical protein [Mycobacterium sp.]HTY35415.1 hypothetical protein [Mycobacterium sp.]